MHKYTSLLPPVPFTTSHSSCAMTKSILIWSALPEYNLMQKVNSTCFFWNSRGLDIYLMHYSKALCKSYTYFLCDSTLINHKPLSSCVCWDSWDLVFFSASNVAWMVKSSFCKACRAAWSSLYLLLRSEWVCSRFACRCCSSWWDFFCLFDASDSAFSFLLRSLTCTFCDRRKLLIPCPLKY